MQSGDQGMTPMPLPMPMPGPGMTPPQLPFPMPMPGMRPPGMGQTPGPEGMNLDSFLQALLGGR